MVIASALVLAGTAAADSTTAMTTARVFTNLDEVRACYPLADGSTLVGTGGGLVRYTNGKAQAVWTSLDGLPATRIDSIVLVDGTYWIGTERGGAQVTVAQDGMLHVGRVVESAAVHDIARFDGVTYLATDDGVRRVDVHGATAIGFAVTRSKTPATSALAAANARQTTSLAALDGVLYVGTAAGLFRLTNGKLERVRIDDAHMDDVAALEVDGATLWIATAVGLYARTGDVVRGYGGGELRSVRKLDGEIVVAGIGSGVQRVDRGRLVNANVARELVMAQAITAAASTTSGTASPSAQTSAACAGGLDGLWLRARGSTTWSRARKQDGLPANDVSALAVDGDALWIGTFDHGVARFRGGVWTTIESAHLDRRVNALLVESRSGTTSRVWVATATGISIIDGDVVSELGKADGLPARGVLSLARLRDGRILAGTMHGAVVIGAGRPALLGVKQGLGVSNVWAVAEDAAGFLWLGTTTGVFRGKADDTSWTRYATATKQLRDDWVMSIVTGGAGTVFVGTYKGGVTRFDVAGDQPMTSQLGDGWINPSGLAWRDGVLYAATMEGLRTSDGKALSANGSWATNCVFTARDTTATARLGATTWIATRRGIVALASSN